MPSDKQGRYWGPNTLFDDYWMPHLPQGIVYICGQREVCPTTNRLHWQIAFTTEKKTTLFNLKKRFGNQWSFQFSNSKASEEYCNEAKHPKAGVVAGSFFELGQKPMKRNSKEDWDVVLKAAKEGRFDDIPADIQVRHYGNLRNIKADYEPRPDDLEAPCGLWIYGGAGVGKSTKARTYGEYFNKPLTKWWTGYKNEPNVILEDIDHTTCKHMGHFLKIWSDKYEFTGNVHGTSRHLRPKKIIVTSNYTIRELYGEDNALCDALLRRFTVEHMVNLMINPISVVLQNTVLCFYFLSGERSRRRDIGIHIRSLWLLLTVESKRIYLIQLKIDFNIRTTCRSAIQTLLKRYHIRMPETQKLIIAFRILIIHSILRHPIKQRLSTILHKLQLLDFSRLQSHSISSNTPSKFMS